MKKIVNDPADVVADTLRGMALAHPDLLRVDLDRKVVTRAGTRPGGGSGESGVSGRRGKVGLLSGGGSGHEPLHAGFVGAGMLDAAVAGEVFTSPVPEQVRYATHLADSGAGVLHVVKNFTGDVMTFEAAAALAAAEGVVVATVVVADDVALPQVTGTPGRRGVAGTVLVEKLAGAAAEQGRTLGEVLAVAQRAAASCASMGVALTSCTAPAVGRPLVDLPDDEVELGVGIHGEPGRVRRPHAGARELAALLLDPVLDDLSLARGTPVLVLTNGLGATPPAELYLLHGELGRRLAAAGLEVARSLVGTFTTALDTAGASVTVLALDPELLGLWDAPVRTPALRWNA